MDRRTKQQLCQELFQAQDEVRQLKMQLKPDSIDDLKRRLAQYGDDIRRLSINNCDMFDTISRLQNELSGGGIAKRRQ